MALEEGLLEQIREFVEETVKQALEEKFRSDLGELAARAINERRRAQGKSDLDL